MTNNPIPYPKDGRSTYQNYMSSLTNIDVIKLPIDIGQKMGQSPNPIEMINIEESNKTQLNLEDKQLSLFEIKYHVPNTFGNTQVELKQFTDAELVNWCVNKNLIRVRRV
jgi:hypothetical protein